MIEIDGSVLEGGGQILRTSVALSAVTGVPVRVFNIRAKRRNPGLRAQHLNAIKAVAELVGAKVEGLKIGSSEVRFFPSKPRAGNFRVDIGTAGSVALVLQALMPAAAFAPGTVRVVISGGTNAAMAPQIDYTINVLLPILARMGYKASIEVLRRGCYPRGGGLVRAAIKPVKCLKPLVMVERGKVKEVKGVSWCERLPRHVAVRQAEAARRTLTERGLENVDVKVEVGNTSLSPGSGVILWALTDTGAVIGADSLGEKGKRAEIVGREAAEKLMEELKGGGALDSHAGDQVIPYMALAKGKSEVAISKLTLHAQTNIYIVEKVLRIKFNVEGELNKPARVEVEGVGLENPNI